MENKKTTILDERQTREYKKTNTLADNIAVAFSDLDSSAIIRTLSSLALSVKQDVKKSILEDDPSDTDLHLNKLTDITDLMAFLHILTNEFDLYHNYS